MRWRNNEQGLTLSGIIANLLHQIFKLRADALNDSKIVNSNDENGYSGAAKGAIRRRTDGVQYAGTHLFVDMWGASATDDEAAIREAVLQAVKESDATLLKMESSSFGEHAGVTVFAILAESHICVNTWFDERMVAIDVFFCAGLDPYRCVPALQAVFAPERMQVSEHKRLMASPLTHAGNLL